MPYDLDELKNGEVIHAKSWAGGIPGGEWRLIREAVKRGQLTGNSRFAEQVEKIVGRRIETRGPGRPVKEASECGK